MLHMIGPAGSIELLKHCFQLLLPGGRLIIQAQYLNDDRVSPRWPTLLNLLQRVATPGGRNHTVNERKNGWKRPDSEMCITFTFPFGMYAVALLGERPLSS